MSTFVNKVAGVIALSLTVVGPDVQAQTQDQLDQQRAEREVAFCYDPSANRRITDQLTQGNCAAISAAGIAGIVGKAPPEVVGNVFAMRQSELGPFAAEFACHRKGIDANISDQIAVRLIQVCQCHNSGAVGFVENNQNYIRAALGRRGGCR